MPPPAPILVSAPSELTDEEKAEFVNFVADAGEVALATLPALVESAVALITMHDGQLIGTAAIKRPYDQHRRDAFAKAGAPELADKFPLEIGWIVVHPNHRKNGNGSALVRAAIDAASSDSVYATTKSDGMKRILSRLGFEKLGDDYPSALDPSVRLALFVRN